MKKILLVLIIILVLVAGFLIYFFSSNPDANRFIRVIMRHALTPSDQKLNQWAEEKKDLTFCLAMNDPTGKSNIMCLSDLAKNIKNPHLCDEISSHHWIAADHGDIERCYKNITDSFNSVSEKIAICNESTIIDNKNICLLNITEDYYKNGTCNNLNLDDCIKKISE